MKRVKHASCNGFQTLSLLGHQGLRRRQASRAIDNPHLPYDDRGT
eukprot:CAMPEP_0117543388 /NCGR_PEP_ID=MMETSP0784-20121206/45037_1 /TAXON_ID=39447 /ORGANISM="" /LENGTH=44 /DNA_ID= /DNA_START= /DNA_END= /DNA_ORIENTATION=